MHVAAVNGAVQTGLPFTMPDPPDTAALVRIDPSSRKLDTAAFFKIPKMKMNMNQTEKGMTMTSEINPMPLVDDWAVLSRRIGGDRARPRLPHRLGQCRRLGDDVAEAAVRLAAPDG